MLWIKKSAKRKVLHLSEMQAKQNRRRKLWSRAALIAFCAILIGVSEWVVVGSDLFRFNNLVISGENVLTDNEVESYLRDKIPARGSLLSFLGYNHFFAWPNVWARTDLIDMPIIKRINFSRDYLEKTIRVDVEERDLFLTWCKRKEQNEDTNCAWMDSEGIFFDKALMPEGHILRIIWDYSSSSFTLGQAALTQDKLANLALIFELLDRINVNWSQMYYNKTDDDLEVIQKEGPLLLFSLDFPSLYAADVIMSLKDNTGYDDYQYIDFRIPEKVFYR